MVARKWQTGMVWLGALALASSVLVSACGGGGDDEPEGPFEATNCQVLWASSGSSAGAYDLLVLDGPVLTWTTSGTKSFALVDGPDTTLLFYDEYFENDDVSTFATRAVTTSGTFSATVAVSGTGAIATGSAVSVEGEGPYTLVEIDDNGHRLAGIGTAGAFAFEGVWSPTSEEDDPTPGTGEATAAVLGTSLTFGTYSRYAVCYDATTASAAESALSRAAAALDHDGL